MSWTLNDYVFDGNAGDDMTLACTTSSPEVRQYSAGYGGALTTWAVQVVACIAAVFNGGSSASSVRRNRDAPVTGSLGSAGANGFALAVKGNLTNPGNITASEISIYSQAHPVSTLDRFAKYAAKKWGIV